MILKRIICALLTIPFLLTGVGIVSAPKASASRATYCTGPAHFNRRECYGYFTGGDAYSGSISVDSIITNGGSSLMGVRNASDFTSLINRLLFVGGKDEIGAAFIVDTMLGRWGTDYGSFNSGILYARANFGTWSTMVNDYDHGLGGRVDWNPGNGTTFFRAPFQDSARSLLGANDDEIFYMKQLNESNPVLTFYNPDGTTYMLKKNCGNLVGSPEGLTLYVPPPPRPPPPFDLQPIINTTITEGGSVIGGNIAQVGDTINFNYAIQNNNWGISDVVNCTVYGNTFTGYHSIPGPPDKGPVRPVGTGCPRSFPGNSTSGTGGDTVTAAATNQTICRSFFVNPAVRGGGERGTESCVVVVARPYAKVFGGDTSAGNRFGTNCIQNTNAGLTSWNRESSGGYAGAGTQFAAKALGSIIDFSSAQNTGGAAAPYGLSFANTSRSASTFGGLFGSLGDCLPDYYGGLPATATSRSVAQVASLSSLGSGVFTVNGNVNISGNITSGQRTVLYVKGDVNINGNITYPGSWTYDKIPQLEIIAQGDIYVNSNVSQIAGTYIAQSNGASGGWIYSCTLSNAPQSLTGSIYNPCQTQLTVNGQLIGEQVLLLRTRNSLVPDSSAGETNTNSKAAEIFNFTPADWVAQPPAASNTNTGLSSRYDAISSLPPVL